MSAAAQILPAPYAAGLNQVGYATLVSCCFFMVLSVLAVSLRLWTRIIKNVAFGVDDWLIILSVFIFFGFCADVLVGVYTVGGGQVYADPLEMQLKEVQFLQSEYAIPALYGLNVTPIKLSILFLYRRIFTTASFRKIANIVIAFCLIWFIAAMISDILYCIPIQSFWDPTADGSCFNFPAFFLAMELVDILLDVVIICLPIKIIWGLHLSSRKKIALLGILLIGAFVIVTGAIRIGYVYKPAQASLWSVINLGVAILCACLPTYRPLLPKILSLGSTLRKTDASAARLKSSIDDSGESGTHANSYHRMGNGYGDSVNMTNLSSSHVGGEVSYETPSEGIRVRKDFDVV